MISANIDQETVFKETKQQMSNFFHWYKIAGFYLLSIGLYVTLNLVNSQERNYWSIVIGMRWILLLVAIIFVLFPILSLRRSNTSTSKLGKVFKFIGLNLIGLLIGFILFYIQESPIIFGSVSGNQSYVLANNLRIHFLGWLLLFSLYILGYRRLSRSHRNKAKIDSYLNIDTQAYSHPPAEQSQPLTKAQLLTLQKQQPVNQQQKPSYTYTEFINQLFQRHELLKLTKIIYAVLVLYFGFITMLLVINPYQRSGFFDLPLLAITVGLLGGSVVYTYHVYKTKNRSDLDRDLILAKGGGLLLISIIIILLLDRIDKINVFRYDNSEIVLIFVLLIAIFMIYQMKTNKVIRDLLLGKLAIYKLKKSVQAQELTKRYLVLNLKSLHPDLADVTPITLNTRIHNIIEQDLKRLQMLLETNIIWYYSPGTLMKYCQLLLAPIISILLETVRKSYTDTLLSSTVDPEKITIDANVVWAHLSKQLIQWESEFESIN